MHGKTMMAAGAVGAVLLMLLGAFAVPGSVSAAPTSLSGDLTTATGTTTDFGGGNYFYVKFGSDAAFGIVWGTNETPNNVYFVAIKARYLGMAQVYDTEGQLVAANRTIKIATVYAVALDDLLEFNDSNQNGVLQYHRVYAYNNFTGTYIHNEPMYKKVSLKTAWEQSAVTDSSTSSERIWTFDLTAKDLSYVPLDNYSYSNPSGDNKLNELKLTFHLTASMVQVDNATIPQWRVTVQRGGMGMGGMGTGGMMFNNIQPMADMTVSGKMLSYHVKWDQAIQGWDFDANNSNKALLMEFGAIVGNYIPPAMMASLTWMQMNTIRQMNEYGSCVGYSGSRVDIDSSTSMMSTPRMLSSPMLTFGGDKTRIGALQWVSNVTVDGNDRQLHAQIMGGVPIVSMGVNGALFAGFAVLGGISFPGGAMIVHDPTFSSDALLDVSTSRAGLDFPWFLMGAVLLIAVMVIIVVVALVLMEKKPGQKQQPPQQNYERTYSSQPGEWAKYYPKK